MKGVTSAEGQKGTDAVNDALFFGFSAHRFELENLVPTFSEMEGTN
jgi:hypothetical protein